MRSVPDLAGCSDAELIALVDELDAALEENAQRWFSAPSPAAARTVFEERKALHRRRSLFEEELRRRWEGPDPD